MTINELRELVATTATTDVETAGRAYCIGRAKAYSMAKAGEFPVPVLKVGHRYRVRTADLAADLLHDEAAPVGAETASTTPHPGHEEKEIRDAQPTRIRAV